jgi:hypothetical protein
MATRPARTVAQRRSHGGYWLDHAEIIEADFEWLASAERLTLWNVRIPMGFLARLPKLWWLDVRGGSAKDLEVARGVERVRYLAVNQVRGLHDLSVVSELLALRYVLLFGLPQVTRLPSFVAHTRLARASLGQMRGLTSISEILEAPRLRELQLIGKINVSAKDVERIANHQMIKRFGWVAEGVPGKVWVPIVEKIGLPEPEPCHPEEWFSLTKPSC